jgi:hypothetical protein
VKRRVLISGLLAGAALVPASWVLYEWITFPSDRTPLGAYLRIVSAVNRGKPEEFFAYVETAAQHACYTIRDYRKKSRDLVLQSYPAEDRQRAAATYERFAAAPDGADVFAIYAREKHWLDRLRRDMSKPVSVEENGERATLITARGTRYPFRRRENGIWGLTLFTATLVAEAQRSARDAELVEKAARDFELARKRER